MKNIITYLNRIASLFSPKTKVVSVKIIRSEKIPDNIDNTLKKITFL